MQTTNNTVIQIETVKKPSVLSVIKKYVKWFFLPQWKKWKARNFINRIVEAVYMQEAEQGLSPDNLQQLHALEREISQTSQLARYRFTKTQNLRTKQLCGHHLTNKEQDEAFDYAVEKHFASLSHGVVPTEDDQSLSRIREEAIAQALKNTPAVKDCRTQDSGVIDFGANTLNAMASIVEATQVALDATPETTVVSNTTPLTDKQLMDLRKEMTGKTSIGQLRLPQLKLYAKAYSIRIPGRTTRIKEIKNIVVAAQGSNKLLKI